jgi:predicted ATPase
LEGLELPPLEETSTDLNAYDATALFLACTLRLQPGYRPTSREASEVACVCRLLEGTPLGTELAAARTWMLLVVD